MTRRWGRRVIGTLPDPWSVTYSIDFDGSNDAAVAGSAALLAYEYSEQFSYGCWIKTTDTGNVVMGKQEASGNYRGWRFGVRAGGVVRAEMSTTGTNTIVRLSSATVDDGAWHHVFITNSGSGLASGLKIYIDGSLDASTVVDDDLLGGTIVSGTAKFALGARYTGTSAPYAGLVNNAAVYTSELTAGEVAQVYGGGSPPDIGGVGMPAGLTHWWKCGDGDTYSTLLDSVGGVDLPTIGSMTAGDVVEDAPSAP